MDGARRVFSFIPNVQIGRGREIERTVRGHERGWGEGGKEYGLNV